VTQLILGTAQFGSGYGITNNRRRIDDQTVIEIVDMALARGISLFDTATDYGDSQDRLGALAEQSTKARFITKFSLAETGEPPTAESLYEESMRRLGVEKLAGLLFHKVADLSDERSLLAFDVVRRARDAGIIDRVGVSIYDKSDLNGVLTAFPDIDILQIPCSIVDRRLLDDDDVHALSARGVEIHVRSVFLQGLLLADPSAFDERFVALSPVVDSLRSHAMETGVELLELLLSFVRDCPIVDAVLVGATSVAEIGAIADAWGAPSGALFEMVPALPLEVIDPRRW